MVSNNLIKQYAKLAVKIGANVQEKQMVVIRASTDTVDFVREVVEQSYLAGAKKVDVVWSDPYITRHALIHQSLDDLSIIPEWSISRYQYYVKENAAFISVISPVPGLNADVESKKAVAATRASNQALSFFRNHTMSNKSQWTVVAIPNDTWANTVFPTLSKTKALENLWAAIFSACRVSENTNVVDEWDKHNKYLLKNNEKLNSYNFESLHFENSLGTNITIGLAKDHNWAGGGEIAGNNAYFNPNIPTEESFCMPHKSRVNGIVYSSMPLNYQDKIIDKFWLKFENGRVVDFDAKTEKDTLQELLNSDEGSRHIGEIALVDYDSPISKMGILFHTTLFDENASCHIALGAAYPMNIKNGTNMSVEELTKRGYNKSHVHVDFMFGTKDLTITGKTHDNILIPIFKKGSYVI